jgi:hypothetical protein
LASGTIHSGNRIGPVTIMGSVRGFGGGSGEISAFGSIAAVTIGGSLVSGPGANSGSINAFGVIGPIVIKGDVIGTGGNDAEIQAIGQVPPSSAPGVALASIHIGGRVQYADIRAGWDESTFGLNADAQIGSVTVDGDWIASSISAGVTPGADGYFTTADDATLSGPNVTDLANVSSRIASVTIGGQALGTMLLGDRFGIEAQIIGVVKVGATTIMTHVAGHRAVVVVGITSDVDVKEIP